MELKVIGVKTESFEGLAGYWMTIQPGYAGARILMPTGREGACLANKKSKSQHTPRPSLGGMALRYKIPRLHQVPQPQGITNAGPEATTPL